MMKVLTKKTCQSPIPEELHQKFERAGKEKLRPLSAYIASLEGAPAYLNGRRP